MVESLSSREHITHVSDLGHIPLPDWPIRPRGAIAHSRHSDACINSRFEIRSVLWWKRETCKSRGSLLESRHSGELIERIPGIESKIEVRRQQCAFETLTTKSRRHTSHEQQHLYISKDGMHPTRSRSPWPKPLMFRSTTCSGAWYSYE